MDCFCSLGYESIFCGFLVALHRLFVDKKIPVLYNNFVLKHADMHVFYKEIYTNQKAMTERSSMDYRSQ